MEALQDFQVTLLNRLQALGQTAFYLAYEDLQSVEVMNGLAGWLGVPQHLEALDDSLKRQNPAPVLAKVSNPDAMQDALSGMDRFNLTRTPNFEPRRGPAVPGYVAGVVTPLLYLPVKGGPEAEVVSWMASLDHVSPDGLIQGMNQKQLRQWKRGNKGYRSFTVLRHPAERAHTVFCRRILNVGEGSYRQIRNTLQRNFGLVLPEGGPYEGYTLAQHRAAFEGFLTFAKASLSGQTSVRVDAEWASQSQALAGFAELGSPDFLIREDEMGEDLPALARKLGRMEPGAVPATGPQEPFSLADIYDAGLEALIASVYQRDYLSFGFGPWRDS